MANVLVLYTKISVEIHSVRYDEMQEVRYYEIQEVRHDEIQQVKIPTDKEAIYVYNINNSTQ